MSKPAKSKLTPCPACVERDDEEQVEGPSEGLIICDMCSRSFHLPCVRLHILELSREDDWFCPTCR